MPLLLNYDGAISHKAQLQQAVESATAREAQDAVISSLRLQAQQAEAKLSSTREEAAAVRLSLAQVQATLGANSEVIEDLREQLTLGSKQLSSSADQVRVSR